MANKKTPEETAANRARSNANLKRGGSKETEFKSGRNAAENGRKGGLKAQKIRKETRTYRELIELVQGSKPVITPRIRDILLATGMDPDNDNITNALVAAVAVSQKANNGDQRAWGNILEITRQDPTYLLEQERLEVERESLKQGISGYSALDEAFAQMHDGSEEP